jgi:hypothetical protein
MIDPSSARVTVFEDFAVSADALYAMLGDFTNLSWTPQVPKVEFVGEGPGMVRNMYIAETLPPIVERLDALDPEARSVTYSITENNLLPVTDYQATMTVLDTGPDTCRLQWCCDFEPDGITDEEAVVAIQAFYGSVLPGIHSALGEG